MNDMVHDIAIIGGGILGLATGLAFTEHCPNIQLLILEKESDWAAHQSGNNSGVLHSGIYYRPGSLKAQFCIRGNRSLVDFCAHQGIQYEICGKTIVATKKEELPLLERLYQRGLKHGLKVEKKSSEQMSEIEPHVKYLEGLWVPTTCIVDFRKVCLRFADIIASKGAECRLNTEVKRIHQTNGFEVIETNQGEFKTRFTINCAGLQSDRLARLWKVNPPIKILPFRGEYYELIPEKRHLVNGLVYPVPHPDFPFLGVHFTRMIDGRVRAGPNAVLSFKREGYKKSDLQLSDLLDVITYQGFWRLAINNINEGIKELARSYSKELFVRSLQRLIPEVRSEDLVPCPSGVRAQAVSRDGKLVDDFEIISGPNSIHVLNAPSPAATSSIEIGKAIVQRARKQFSIKSRCGI